MVGVGTSLSHFETEPTPPTNQISFNVITKPLTAVDT